jgi:drug/metabolite transporter (DMT)-like permease
MPSGQATQSNTWVLFALMTVLSWGVYGVFLHTGQQQMGDPVNGRYKAFLFVGIAYFLTAIIAPLIVLMMNRANWSMPASGMTWSLVAGIVGAIGAFFALLALGAAKGSPAVMSVIFAGAPVVNAIATILMHPPEGGLAAVKPQFVLGLILAATGGFLVTMFRPQPAPSHKPGKPAASASATPQLHKSEAEPL